MTDLYQLIEKLDSIAEGGTTPIGVKHGLNKQQQSVDQLPALFKPKKISVLTAKTDPQHPMKGHFVGGESADDQEGWGSMLGDAGAESTPDGVSPDTKMFLEKDMEESLRSGEYHIATVTFDDGSTQDVRITSDEGFRDPIIKHFAKQGKTVTDIKVDYGVRSDLGEARATEDVLSTVKKKLGDYLADLSQQIKQDPDLKDRVPQDIDKIGPAVKTIQTDDGHELKIHGNEDDGFRITIKNRPSKSRFGSLDEAVMACEMYCNRRRDQASTGDYMEER